MLLSSKGFQGRKSFSDITDTSKNKMVFVLRTNYNITNSELLFSDEQKLFNLTNFCIDTF